MMVSAGLPQSALGNTELSQIQRLPTSKLRPASSTTAWSGSVPIRQVPIVCAARGKTRRPVAPAASHTALMNRTA